MNYDDAVRRLHPVRPPKVTVIVTAKLARFTIAQQFVENSRLLGLSEGALYTIVE